MVKRLFPYLKPYKKHKVVLLSDNDAYEDIYSDK